MLCIRARQKANNRHTYFYPILRNILTAVLHSVAVSHQTAHSANARTHTHTMLQYQRLSFQSVAAVLFGLNAICGNAPFTYQRSAQLFRTTRAHLIYPAIITAAYIGLHIHFYSRTLVNGTLMHRLVVISRYALCVVTLVQNGRHRRRLVAHLNDSRSALARIGRQWQLSGLRLTYGGSVVWVATGIVATAVVTLYGSFGMFDVAALRDRPTTANPRTMSLSFVLVAMVLRLFSYLMQSVAVNSFYVLMRIMRFYFERLVERIEAVMVEASALAEDNRSTVYERMRRFGELSERLDALAVVHAKLVHMCRRHNRLLSVQLLLAIGFMLLVLATQLIIVYDKIRDGEAISVQYYSYMAAYALGVLFEMYRLCDGCANTVHSVSGGGGSVVCVGDLC